MTVKSDPPVSIAIVSAATFRSEKTLTLAYLAGELPHPDSVMRDCCNRRKIRAWRLSTIRTWNPTVAARCQAVIDALETAPPLAA